MLQSKWKTMSVRLCTARPYSNDNDDDDKHIYIYIHVQLEARASWKTRCALAHIVISCRTCARHTPCIHPEFIAGHIQHSLFLVHRHPALANS